jgi:SNF2 family DNA or RNA helicase
LTIADTVEDKLLALQEKKQQVAKSALDQNGATKKLNKLNMADFLSLFSRNAE